MDRERVIAVARSRSASGWVPGASPTRTPPQRLRSVKLTLHIKGSGVTEEKATRAVNLSRETYCSVRHSLREDIEVETDLFDVVWKFPRVANV